MLRVRIKMKSVIPMKDSITSSSSFPLSCETLFDDRARNLLPTNIGQVRVKRKQERHAGFLFLQQVHNNTESLTRSEIRSKYGDWTPFRANPDGRKKQPEVFETANRYTDCWHQISSQATGRGWVR
jgi:hypothetical protein